jgi:hypothetical protein
MITSIYRGGLGNQLFQVAAGYFLAKSNNDIYCINSNLHEGRGQGNHITSYIDNIFKNIPKTDYKSNNLYKEPKFNYTHIDYTQDMLLDGYFQSEKYFNNYRKEMNDLFSFDEDSFERKTCVIQIRTGDYIHSYNFDVVTKKYFADAIKYVLDECPSLEFKVVTDDESRIKNYITDVEYSFISNDELSDIKALSKADYAIISNSSFGWWGSYLGKNKTTIVPDKWFKNINYDVSDIYRNDMIKIKI